MAVSSWLNQSASSSQYRFIGTPQITSPSSKTPDFDNKLDLIDIGMWAVKICYWTTFLVSDHLAAELFSKVLEVEFPVYELFNTSLFARDLVMQDIRFRSFVLVSSAPSD